ncbi:MAG: S1C family serine protease [Terracidiphilus sp.]|jgi:S1-C subfamily serine protease
MRPLPTIGSALLCALGIVATCAAQSPAPALTPAQIVDRAAPAVAMVLAFQSPGDTSASTGAALVVYADGDLLTSYHLIRNAYALQVRFKSGEVFDRVKLLGVDERRDVAAIRITASGLPVLPVASPADISPGDPVVSIFHPQDLPWSTSTGVLSAYRLADEIPGASSGFRALQFTAPASPGASGGVLIDARGRALGLITGALNGGQSLSFAVPIESVVGLADTPPTKTFASGAQLPPLHPAAPVAPAAAVSPAAAPPAPATPAPAASTPTTPSPAPQPAQKLAESGTAASSELAASKDRDYILRHFQTMYIDAHADYFGSKQVKAALGRNKDFAGLNIVLVDDPKAADTILAVSHTFGFNFPFELKHQASSIVLLSGKGVGIFSGQIGSVNVAGEFVKAAQPFRTPPPKP